MPQGSPRAPYLCQGAPRKEQLRCGLRAGRTALGSRLHLPHSQRVQGEEDGEENPVVSSSPAPQPCSPAQNPFLLGVGAQTLLSPTQPNTSPWGFLQSLLSWCPPSPNVLLGQNQPPPPQALCYLSAPTHAGPVSLRAVGTLLVSKGRGVSSSGVLPALGCPLAVLLCRGEVGGHSSTLTAPCQQ